MIVLWQWSNGAGYWCANRSDFVTTKKSAIRAMELQFILPSHVSSYWSDGALLRRAVLVWFWGYVMSLCNGLIIVGLEISPEKRRRYRNRAVYMYLLYQWRFWDHSAASMSRNSESIRCGDCVWRDGWGWVPEETRPMLANSQGYRLTSGRLMTWELRLSYVAIPRHDFSLRSQICWIVNDEMGDLESEAMELGWSFPIASYFSSRRFPTVQLLMQFLVSDQYCRSSIRFTDNLV